MNSILPRLIRLRDAPAYLGMNKNLFNSDVRKYLTEVAIGVQGVAFDRLELDTWADDYIERNGQKRISTKGEISCQNARPGLRKEVITGTSKRKFEGMEGFEKALKLVTTLKQKNT